MDDKILPFEIPSQYQILTIGNYKLAAKIGKINAEEEHNIRRLLSFLVDYYNLKKEMMTTRARQLELDGIVVFHDIIELRKGIEDIYRALRVNGGV